MDVLSSRVLLAPSEFERSRAFYAGTLGLHVYREFGAGGRVTGVVFFLGGGFLELSGSGAPAAGVVLWLQVPDVDAEHERLCGLGVTVAQAPTTMPWGLREMVVLDPDGARLFVVEVPADHPLRRRLD